MEKLFDLRFVIGAFFTITGILLLGYGFMENASINKGCGAVFVLFGVFMILLAYMRPVSDPNVPNKTD